LQKVGLATAIPSLLASLNGPLLCRRKTRGSDLLFAAMLLGVFVVCRSMFMPLVRIT
jgi:ABC-type glycerol-3-phosphate transport system permease component